MTKEIRFEYVAGEDLEAFLAAVFDVINNPEFSGPFQSVLCSTVPELINNFADHGHLGSNATVVIQADPGLGASVLLKAAGNETGLKNFIENRLKRYQDWTSEDFKNYGTNPEKKAAEKDFLLQSATPKPDGQISGKGGLWISRQSMTFVPEADKPKIQMRMSDANPDGICEYEIISGRPQKSLMPEATLVHDSIGTTQRLPNPSAGKALE